METIRGKTSLDLDLNEFTDRLVNYNRVIVDLGTGDGRYVHCLADRFPDDFIIGVDSCRENLHEHSRAKLPNMLFIIASAQNLPPELNGLVSHVSINFPWGSLLQGLLDRDSRLLGGLESITTSNATINMHLNSGALAEAGTDLGSGTKRIYNNMVQAGWQVNTPGLMDARTLRTIPTTWAKRLAFGRDPQAMHLSMQRT